MTNTFQNELCILSSEDYTKEVGKSKVLEFAISTSEIVVEATTDQSEAWKQQTLTPLLDG